MRASQSTSRAISPSERTAAPDTGASSARSAGQRAGHELALADERRDRQRDAALLALHDDGELAVVGALVAESGGGVVERQDGVADDEHALAGGGAHGVVDEADGAVDAVERDAEDAAAGAHEQRRHDGQRQRQADLGRRARAGLGGQQDLAAELADLGAHGVHPDPAARDVVGLVAGGEAGREEQLDGAGHVDRVGLLGGDEPGADGLGGDGVAIDAAAVVGHRDDDVAAGVAGGDAHGAGGGLAGGLALGGRLEAVVERVAHEVHERIAERVDDGAVELGVLADELELDVLAELAREVADEPREAQEDGLHGDHADLHDDRLQGVRAAREVLPWPARGPAPRPGRRGPRPGCAGRRARP